MTQTNDQREHEWAVALKKAQNQSRGKKTTPLDTRCSQLTKDLRDAKEHLKQAIGARDDTAQDGAMRRLIGLRASLAALQMELAKQRYGKPTRQMIQNIRQRYARDCIRLVSVVGSCM